MLAIAFATLGRAGVPELAVAPAFGDQMVWPREVAVPLWGTGMPGAVIEARFAGQARTTRVDAAGGWRVVFDAVPGSVQARRVEVIATAGGAMNVRILNDVIVGDVWLAAGQSNMKWPLRQAAGGAAAGRDAPDRLRLLRFSEAATGDAGAYTADQFTRLAPDRYFSGGWRAADLRAAAEFSAVAWFFARRLADELKDVPVGVIQVAVGGTPIEAWIDRAALTEGFPDLVQGNWLDNPRVGAWCRQRARANLRSGAGPADDLGPAHPFKPGFQWAAGIAPLAPFPVKGVLWYQGESNAEEDWQIADHDRLFPLLVSSWRTAFGRDLPFLFVQLPGLQRPHWPAFRESQRRSLDRLPGLGMAVTIDLGDPRDVHPADKQPVGERLARLALNQVYGRDLLPTGPLPRTLVQTGNECRVTFDHARGLVTRDGEAVFGFETRAAEGGFQPALARIEGEQVVLPGPVHEVRYGWQPFPDPPLNLVNADGLPAAPFHLEVATDPPRP